MEKNKCKVVKLSTLICNGKIRDESIIQIYDANGCFITRGHWYQDNILNWGEHRGIAHRMGAGFSISFNLI